MFGSKSTSEFVGVQISSIFHFQTGSNLIFNHIPIFFFYFFINFLIIIPIKMLVLDLISCSQVLKLFESMALEILIKRYTLRKILQNLISCGKLLLAVNIECKRWPKAFRRDNFDASVQVSLFFTEQFINVNDRILKFFFSWSEYRHFLNILKLIIAIFRFNQRILYCLIDQFLLLF